METLIIEEDKGRSKRTDFHARAFVNKLDYDAGARIKTEVSVYKHKRMSYENSDSFQVDITDCNNKVRLHGELSNQEDIDNALYKIGKLIEVLQETRNFIYDNTDKILNKTRNKRTEKKSTIEITEEKSKKKKKD